MSVAWIFPGHGSQWVGMGRDLYESYPAAREIYDRAQNLLDFDLVRLSFDGPEEELRQTYVTQPAIFVHSVAVQEVLRRNGLSPDMTAGHSLGEYSALVAAGAMDFEDALSLVALRGRLMQRAGEERPGTMAAIIGLGMDEVEAICRDAEHGGVVVPANFNSPQQIVISGSVSGVREAMGLAETAGASKVV
jgi:[acyl-carrier-protein] S-malonyltransferase